MHQKTHNRKEKWEKVMKVLFSLAGFSAVICLVTLSGYLIYSGVPALSKMGIRPFLLGDQWASTAEPPLFGIRNFLLSSFFGTTGAILIAFPMGMLVSLWLSKFAPKRVRSLLMRAVDILGSIPSVVYGLIGMLVLVPGIRTVFQVPDGSSLLAAILVLSVMILPPVIKLSVQALEAVPKEFEEGSLALGATREETILKVTLPAAKSGLAAALVLGTGRALGETMAVMMVAGNVPRKPKLLGSVRLLTTAISSEMAYASGLQREALFSVALVLFLFILLINGLLNRLVKGKGR